MYIAERETRVVNKKQGKDVAHTEPVKATGHFTSRALKKIAPKESGPRIAAVLVVVLAMVILCLIYVPYQQTIVGYGQVIVYSASDRPQGVEALIPGRLKRWNVQEGMLIKKGTIIAEIEDIDSKFLDADIVKRLEKQRADMQDQRQRAMQRIADLEAQRVELLGSQKETLKIAEQRIRQARERERGMQQALIAAQKAEEIARQVAKVAAEQRLEQAKDRIIQAQQALTFAKQNLETARLQRDRMRDLFKEGLRSKRDDELAENELVRTKTEVERAEQALKIARRDRNVSDLEQNRADIEIERARTEVERAFVNLDVARRDVSNAVFDRTKLQNDTNASLNNLSATIESARENVAKVNADLQKIEVEVQNTTVRRRQQIVRAPRDGQITRLLILGEGETVKAGDTLAILVPKTDDIAVEIMVSDNDVPLISPGRHVRLQFAGWPAVQFAGFPSVAVGTFGGKVSVIDAVDDGTARYRVIIRPDDELVAAGKDEPWPPLTSLRPGAEATGWVLLDTVPLGFELWRQYNAFPPTVKRPPLGEKEKVSKPLKDKDGEKDKAFIPLKSK